MSMVIAIKFEFLVFMPNFNIKSYVLITQLGWELLWCLGH